MNSETGKSEFVPIDEASRNQAGLNILNEFEAVKSPIDGTVLKTKKQYMDHCRRHGVVPSAEFSQEFFDRKAKERARLYNGERTRKEVLESRRQLWEITQQHERATR